MWVIMIVGVGTPTEKKGGATAGVALPKTSKDDYYELI